MHTVIKGKNLQINDHLREKVQEKLAKISRHAHFVNIRELEVELSVEKNPSIENRQTAEITVFTKGSVIRAKEATADMLASVDLAIDKIERQIEKYKGKIYGSQNHKARHQAEEFKRKQIS